VIIIDNAKSNISKNLSWITWDHQQDLIKGRETINNNNSILAMKTDRLKTLLPLISLLATNTQLIFMIIKLNMLMVAA